MKSRCNQWFRQILVGNIWACVVPYVRRTNGFAVDFMLNTGVSDGHFEI